MTTRQRTLAVVLAIVLVGLWLNAARRAMAGRSSQLDDFLRFSNDLVVERRNVYVEYEPTYTITKYPPAFGYPWLGLVPLPMPLAATIWFWLNAALALGAAALAVALAARGPPPDVDRRRIGWTLLLGGPVVISNLETSQVNIALLFVVLLGLIAFRHGRDGTAGALLGAAAAVKLTPGLFLAYFAWKRRWRVVGGGAAAVAVGWAVLPILTFGPGRAVEIVAAWASVVGGFVGEGVVAEGIGGYRHTNQSLAAVLHRTLSAVPADAGREDFYVNLLALEHATVRGIVGGLGAAIVVGLGWLARGRTSARGGPRQATELALVFIATLFLSPVSWINHYVALLPGYAVALELAAGRPADDPGRRRILIGVGVSFALLLTSASRLLQAFSLPFLGAIALAVTLVGAAPPRSRVEPAASR